MIIIALGIEILNIFDGVDISENANEEIDVLISNSDFLNGLTVKKAIQKAIEQIEKGGFGEGKINYRLRDAIFSRQRYWGEPIPVYFKDDVPYPIEESELPLILPEIDDFKPGKSLHFIFRKYSHQQSKYGSDQ